MKKSGDLNEFERRLGEVIVNAAEVADSAKVSALKTEIAKLKEWNQELFSEVKDKHKFCFVGGSCFNRGTAFCYWCEGCYCSDHLILVSLKDLEDNNILKERLVCFFCKNTFFSKPQDFVSVSL